MVKHAGAEHVTIRVVDPETDERSILVEVEDDGRGFDAGDAGDGFGLMGMRERIALVRGDLEVLARPGGGTRLVGRIPVRRRVR